MGVCDLRAKQGRRSGEGEGEEVGLEDASPVDGGWASVEEAGQGKLGGVAGKEDEAWFSSLLWEPEYDGVRIILNAWCASESCSSARARVASTVASDGRVGRDGDVADIL